MTMFDHARSPRIGQRTPVETTGIQLVTLETLPEAAFRGQMVYRIDDHILQVFDGVAWVTATSSDSGARPIHVGPTPPVADDIGDGWLNTSDYLFYVWDGSEWRVTSADRQVETNQRSLKLAKAIEQLVPLGSMSTVVVTYDTVAPVGVVNGDVWANVGTNTVWNRVSGTWVQVVDPEIVSRVLAAGQERAVVTDATITVFYDEEMPIGLDANDIGDVWWDTTIYRAWTGASWVDIQITGEELAPGAVSNEHLTPGSVSEDNITFDARDIGGVRTTVGSTTPTGNIEGDLWVDTGNGRELKRWNGADWVSVRDEWTTQARADALQALSDAADAISTAGDADAAAQQAQTNASQAISDAEAAILAAGTAQSTANAADGKADTALSDAASAVTTAGQADSKADQAIIDAGIAQSTAEGAVTDAGNAQSLAQQVSDDLDLLGTDLETLNTTILPGLQDDLETLETTVGGHTTQIGNAQSELSTLSGTTIPSLQSDLSDANAALSLHDGRITSAQTAADDAQSAADTADGKAESAATAASVADGKAAAAQLAAATADGKAEAAQSAASTADGKAEAAQGAASAAQSTAEAAQTAASNAASAASTAQTAADDAAADALAAAGLAGSKGKVLIQPTTPATEDRLPQNLWIDTTDGENTPKRWNGSIWEPVTDKAATDAAATAASAQTTATNAASAASTAQGAANAAQSAAEAAQTTATNAATAASNAQDAADDALDGVDAVTGRMTTAEGEISSVTTRLTTAEGEITTVASDVSSLDTTVSGHTTRLSTAEGNITTISGDVSSLSGSVSSLSTRIGDAEDEIENIVTVQLAGKSKVTYSTNPPGSTPNSAGDVWYRRDATKQIIGQWIGLGGTSWDAVTLTDSVITNLSAGTIVTGEMHGDRIQANTIATSHIVTAGLDAATVKFGTMSGDRIEAGTLVIGKVSGLQSALDSKETPTGAQDKADAAQNAAVAAAAQDAQDKAAAAQAAAIAAAATTAQAKADAAEAAAIAAASGDAADKAEAARLAAIATAAADAQTKADEALNDAKADATAKADAALESAQSYVQSRGTNLVTNGTGLLGDNTNFSLFTFTAADAPTGASGSFVTPVSTNFALDEFVPVDPGVEMKFSYYMRQTEESNTTARAYGFVSAYDAYKNPIRPSDVMYTAGTLTTLAAPLNPGDNTVTLTSSANWYGTPGKNAGGSTHLRSFIFWDYVDEGGKEWPPLTYSRNFHTNLYADGAISGNVVTLNAPWSGPAKPAGTQLSNGSSGGTYLYGGAANHVIPNEWTHYSGVIKGIAQNGGSPSFTLGWPHGVAYAKLGFLANRATSGSYETGSKHAVASVYFGDAQAAADKATAAQSTANSAYTRWAPTGQTTIDGGKITADTIVSGHIVAGSIITDHMTANTISGDRIQANTLNASKIVAGSITTDRMTANSISGDRITANTLNASKIVAGSITTDRMTANTINGDRIATNTLNANRIVANSITAGEIAANAISTSELDAGAITAKHTITGATIQTTATANRGVKITSGGLLGYNNSGVAQFTLTSAGALSLTGAIKSGSTIEGASITGTVSVSGGVIQTGTGNSKVVRINSAGIVAYGEEEDDAVLAFETATGHLTIKGDITSGSVISGAEINGGTVSGGEITGGVVEGTSITGTTIYSSDIEVGENIRIGSTHGLQATFGDGHLIIPKDGDEASISGFDGEFKSFIANGNMTINGGDNTLSGRMSLTSSIPDPPNAPVIGYFHWWHDRENAQVQSEGKGLLRGGRHTSTGNKTLLVYSHPRIKVSGYNTSAIGFEWRDSDFDVMPGALNLGYQTGYASVDDVEITSTNIYMLARGKKISPTSATSDSYWWLLRWTRTFSGSTETTDLSAAPTQERSLGISTTHRAGIAWDPVLSRMVLAFTTGGQIFLAEYNSTSLANIGTAHIVRESNGTTFYEWGSDDGIGGFAIGTFDFGDSVNRFMIWRQSADELFIGTRSGTGTGAQDILIRRRTVDEYFPRANTGQTWGTVWNSVAGSFHSYNRVGADYIRQWQYSENRTVSDCSYAYAWVDTNSTGGTHTTKISPYAYGAPRRRFTNIFHRRPPTSGGNSYDEPNDTKFYINNVLQSTGGWKNNETNTWFGTYLATGPAPPASNTFAGLSGSGALESSARNPYAPTEPMWQLSGDGSGRMGLFRWDVNGGVISSPDPAGEIKMYAGETLPQGFLWCNGAAVSRTAYSKLFAAIGTKYGAGNGSTTFNLPNFGDRNPRGAGLFGGVGDTGGSMETTLLAINIPPHTHGSGTLSTNSAGSHTHVLNYSANAASNNMIPRGQGASNVVQTSSAAVDSAGAHSHNVTGNTSSTGIGEPFSTADPYVVVNFIIRTN